ncbi:hypothetical protein KGO5_06158 [Sinorhizobium sp. KGO-5]|jgi:hypothetical protein|nr:hypothetical protein KGO5_06158 [Sinorhizobium sp. KGO-5]
MSTEPQNAQLETGATSRSGAFRALRFIVSPPYAIVFGVLRAAVYSAWYFAFYTLCMFPPAQVS